jgi:hypothetical protein
VGRAVEKCGREKEKQGRSRSLGARDDKLVQRQRDRQRKCAERFLTSFDCRGAAANRAPSAKTTSFDCRGAAANRAPSAKTTSFGMTITGEKSADNLKVCPQRNMDRKSHGQDWRSAEPHWLCHVTRDPSSQRTLSVRLRMTAKNSTTEKAGPSELRITGKRKCKKPRVT